MKNQNWSPFPLIPTVSWLLKQKQKLDQTILMNVAYSIT